MIRTRFDDDATATEVVKGVDMHERRIVITGGASGIGKATARALASTGAEVVLAVRDVATGRAVATELANDTANDRIRAAHLDLTDQASIAAFCASWAGPLHVLINNAGVMTSRHERTRHGWELHFATNHLGHFALAVGLRRALASAAGARLVSVSSGAHVQSAIDFSDIHFDVRPYDMMTAYAQSKTANILFAVEANRRWADDGINANAARPGLVRSKLLSDLPAQDLDSAARSLALRWRSPDQGAATAALLATSAQLGGVGGRYFDECNEAGPHVPGEPGGVARHAVDPDSARQLWKVSIELISVA